MVKTLLRILQTAAGLTLVIAVIYFALSLRPRAGGPAAPATPPDTVAVLEARYTELGIPFEEIRLVKDSPLEVEITLKSASEDDRMSDDDQWWFSLTQREAELVYLITGEHISSYTIQVLNTKKESIDGITASLDPNSSEQQLTAAKPPAIGDDETRRLLMDELNLGGNEWLALDVQSDNITRPNTRYVYMEWSTATDSDEVSKSRSKAVGSLAPFGSNDIEAFNARHGTQIALVRVKVFDPKGNLLAHFILDVERRSQSMRLPQGAEADWLPSPAEPQAEPPTPIPEPTSLPPLPTTIPTPYP